MIEAKQAFTMLYKYDLVVPWQCADIGREVNKVNQLSSLNSFVTYTVTVTLLY